jgi:hypothetical protein
MNASFKTLWRPALFVALFSLNLPAQAAVYSVDSGLGSDSTAFTGEAITNLTATVL